MVFTLLLASLIAAPDLPGGYEQATWGMTAEELQRIADVDRILKGDGFNYAEHLEEEPQVYARMTEQHERIEYYFFQGRLYKIFIIYDKKFGHTPPFFVSMITKMKCSL